MAEELEGKGGLPSEDSEEDYLDLGDLSNVPDEHAVPGDEYELTLVRIEKRNQKKHPERRMLYLQFEIEDDPLSKLITHTILLAHPTEDKRTFERRQRAVRHFYEAFEIPITSGVKLSEYIGNKGWVLLAEESSDQYGDQNKIARFIKRG